MEHNDNFREETNIQSLRERSSGSLARRKKQLRHRIILLNSAFALIIILIVLVVQVISLNSKTKERESKQAVANNGETIPDQKQPKTTAQPEPTPSPTPEPDGSAKWLRTDLDSKKPMVALTFDDGPYTPVTKRIVNALKDNEGRATFFCVANRIPSYPDVVEQAYNSGFQIASHTYEHVILTGVNKKKITEQVNKANQAIKKVIGCEATALRPPGGVVNDKVRNTVSLPMICWNVDSEDWKSRNTKTILKRCNEISDGDIVLMHDLYPTTAAAVEKLAPKLKKKGFQMVTIDELFYYKGIKAKNGQVYFSGK